MITFIFLISSIFLGLSTKNYLAERFDFIPEKDEKADMAGIKKEPEPVQLAKAIWSLAGILAVITLGIFLLFRFAGRSSKSS